MAGSSFMIFRWYSAEMEREEDLEILDQHGARDEVAVEQEPQHVVGEQVRRFRVQRRVGPARAPVTRGR